MKPTLVLLAGLVVGACSETTPTSPDRPTQTTTNRGNVPTPGPAFVWVMVVDEAGICIPGATVEVIDGQRAGESQTQEPCDAWAYDGGVMFQDLAEGVAMILRASALGYMPQVRTIYPSSSPQTAILFTPSRSPAH